MNKKLAFKKNLQNLAVYKPGKPIEEVKRELKLEEITKLASNEIPFVPYYIRSVIKSELSNVNRYPESNCFYLRMELAKKLKIKDEQIVFGNGSDEIITLTLRAFIEKGDEIIVAFPTFLIYEIQGKVEGAKIKRVPLRDFHYDLEEMAKQVTKKTKVIFIANPDNPTGTYLKNEQIEKFLKKIPSSVLVYFDEAYYEFAPSDFPCTDKFLEQRGNIIFTRTFSKAYGLAGLRIGFGVSNQQIIQIINKVREPFNVNRFACVSALAALKNTNFLCRVLSFVKKEKEYFYKSFNKLSLSFIESAANFILVDFKKDTGSLYGFLLKKGVVIRELKDWGLQNFFRVTIGTHKENQKFLRYLSEYLEKSKNENKSRQD